MEENLIEQTVSEPGEVESTETNSELPLAEVEKQPIAQAKTQNNREVNLRELRSAKERAEREREELAKRLERYESQQKQEVAKPEYGDNDFIEGKHLKKEVDAVRAQLKAYEEQSKAAADEFRLKSKYSDFDSVVNTETIERLKEADPEFAETIAYSNSSLYARGSSTYKRIKELGIFVEDNHQQDRERAQQNLSKPRPLNAVSPQSGDSPLSMANAFANGLTPEVKRQLWKEMQEATKRS